MYNSIGELIENKQDGLGYEYNSAGLITRVYNLSNNNSITEYTYNDKGLKYSKTSYSGGLFSVETEQLFYVYDAGGAEVATYKKLVQIPNDVYALQHHTLYGAGRVGLLDKNTGKALYELSDHLGNVRAVVTASANGAAETISYTDYFPHGSALPGRSYQSSLNFPYGYQGQEKDQATGLTNFELRQYDPRIGRWYNPDPYGQHHSPYLAMSNNPVSFTDPDGGWDYDNQYSMYQRMAYTYNSDAYGYSQFDDNYKHGGALGGSINAGGGFYSSDEQIYDAQINNLKYNHSSEYYMNAQGEFAGAMTTYGKFNETDNNGNTIGETSRGIDDPNSTITTHGVFSVKEYTQNEIFAYYGINKKDWETTFRKSKGSGVLVQDIDMGESERNRTVWRNYGRNFNDLADFSEKAVVGIGAGAGVAMTGGVVLLTYGGVEAAGTTVIGAKSIPVVIKALGSIGCFTEGTLIWTINGLEKIEDINTESIVYAYNVSAKKNVKEKVLTAFAREVKKLVKLEYADEIIYTTTEHPFYIKNKWVEV